MSSVDDVVSSSTLSPANKSLVNEATVDAGKKVVTHRRVMKNVGKSENVVYDVKVSSHPSINIDVNPSRLVFSPENQSLSYEVTFTVIDDQMKDTLPKFGWIEWSDGFHKVRSPVAFTWGRGSVPSI
ncbi:Subtilisin-like protease SBT1.4 [Thalictrum thalictroides]|uniref:Subtilisin-like protease SBT1.4 n=1 Tax=Thalictrum thalictroides TaxID=46969 RepID=A0A7J6WQ81_THATH|nr:Subtilisin-like protease SBT1.4 [Thalictrum thalictroides]